MKMFQKMLSVIPIYPTHSLSKYLTSFHDSSQREARNISQIITLYKIVRREFPLKNQI